MDLLTRQINYFSLLILLLTQVIIANIIQNGPSEQKVELTDTNTNYNTSFKISNTSEVTETQNANVIAEQYELHMKQVAQQRSKNKGKSLTSHYHQLETRQNLFDLVDIDLLDMNKDKPNSPQTKRVRNNKATDYYVLSPHPSSRSAKNGKHFGESADTDITTGNGKHKFGLSLATMTANLGLNQPKIIINQPLHPKQRPSANFEVNSNNIMFAFKVGSDDYNDDDDNSAGVDKIRRKSYSRYFISIVVEKMKCTIIPNDENSPKLVIRGGQHELSLCKTIDNSVNNYQSVDYVTNGDKFVTVQGTGDWAKENSTAFLTASIYMGKRRKKNN